MPTLLSMDDKCWGLESPPKEMCSTSVTNFCFLRSGGGPCDPNGQCQDKTSCVCVCVCVYISKWLEHWPGNRKVPCLILLLPQGRNISPV